MALSNEMRQARVDQDSAMFHITDDELLLWVGRVERLERAKDSVDKDAPSYRAGFLAAMKRVGRFAEDQHIAVHLGKEVCDGTDPS